MLDWSTIRFFVQKEFDDPLYPGSGESIDSALVYKMDTLRGRVGCQIITHWRVGGAVDVVGSHNHAKNSFHLVWNGAKACDFHFKTDTDPRQQYRWVEEMFFPGLGVYYCHKWNGKLLPVDFHIDLRPADRLQRWVCRTEKDYIYLLGRSN